MTFDHRALPRISPALQACDALPAITPAAPLGSEEDLTRRVMSLERLIATHQQERASLLGQLRKDFPNASLLTLHPCS